LHYLNTVNLLKKSGGTRDEDGKKTPLGGEISGEGRQKMGKLVGAEALARQSLQGER